MVKELFERTTPANQLSIASDYSINLSVVMPAFNEGQSIGPVLDRIVDLAREHQWEVIAVNDGSTDDTGEQLDQRADGHFLKVVHHPYNRGYGAALKTGIRISSAPLVATMDSDGQHNPYDLLGLIPLARDYHLVVGKRLGLIHSQTSRMPGKWILNLMANYLVGKRIPDLNSGMRLFHIDVMKKYLHICPDGFSFSTTSTLVFINRGYTVAYQPITIHQRQKGAKSTVKLSTGFDALVLILRLATLFQPLRIFIPSSVFFVALGVVWGIPFILLQRGVSVGALLMILTGLLLFFFGLLTDQVAQLRLEKYE